MRRRQNKAKFYLVFSLTVAILAAISHLFIHKDLQNDGMAETTPSDTTRTDVLTDTSWLVAETDYADTNIYYSRKVWSYPECFPDSNFLHIEAAEEVGVHPMSSRKQLDANIRKQLLVDISSSPYYIIDTLTHSVPYLVPCAQQLLNTIGINFIDSLIHKGMPLHRPIVTSVLRTGADIKQLQRGNRNSVSNSAHQYGTTVDITYNRFMPLNGSDPTRFDENLKKVLAEVLFDLREEGMCYVKYERRQACFHLTVR